MNRDPATGQFIQKSFTARVKKLFYSHIPTTYYNAESLLFFGTSDGSLLVYNLSKDDLNKIDIQNKLSITDITGTDNGNIYLGTNGNGIYEYNSWTGEVTRHFRHPDIHKVLKMYADSHGHLWVESPNPGISKIDLNTGKYRHYEQDLDVYPDIRPGAQCGFMEDRKGTLWLTLKGGGFGYYNPKDDEVEYFYNKPGDPERKLSNFVNCFYNDPSGVLWMSTYFRGIEKVTFIPNKFRFIQPAPQSNFSIANEVRAMMEDSKGYLWVATKKQEVFLMDKDFRVVKKIDALNGQQTGRVYAMLEDNNGNIYLGTKGNGLYRLTRKTLVDFNVKHYVHDPKDRTSISSDNIYSLLEDKKGHIWIGTYGGGVDLLVNDRFFNSGNVLKNYPEEKGMKVRCVAQDYKGNIWIGTTEGIIFLDPGRVTPSNYQFHLYNKENNNVPGLRSNDVFWILCDKNKNIWMATLGGGLSRLKNYPERNQPLEFTVFTKKDGLPSDVIFTITDDIKGNLWMSTENGISFFNPVDTVFRNYNQYNGIEKPGFSEAACAVRADGSICLGGNNGLYNFNPSAFGNEQKKANLVFTGFQLFGKEIVPGQGNVLNRSVTETHSIQLKHNQNVVGITWAGLDFSMQDKIQYAYMLEGFDNTWHFTKDRNHAEYTKLLPGKYVFHVKFNNPELQELNPPVLMNIEILPPFWKTTWAYIIYVLLTIILLETARRIITTMIRLRNEVVIEKKLTDIRMNFFTNISHELRTPLTLILGPAKELTSKELLSEKGKSYAGLIEENAQRLLRLVNQLLDFRKIQSSKMKLNLAEVDIVSFTRDICHNFDELAAKKNIRFTVQSKSNVIKIWMDEEKMESVIFNLLSNAFKFTPDNGSINVSVSESLKDHIVNIEVKDSGTGVPKEQEKSLFKVFASHYNLNQGKQTGTGIGLALSKELVELHDGELIYKPTRGGGATFCVSLKTNLSLSQQIGERINKSLLK